MERRIPRELETNYDKALENLQKAKSIYFEVKMTILEFCFKNGLTYCLELTPRWKRYVE